MKTRFGVPIYFSTEKLLKHVNKKSDMSNDNYYRDGVSRISYDGELIELSDGAYRHRRDEARQRNYVRAEENLDDQQMTWTDVENTLNRTG